jgi:hypothetical protein
MHEGETTPTPSAYAAAIQAEATPLGRDLLVAHYNAERQTATAQGLSAAVGRGLVTTWANLHYGRLARAVGEAVGFAPNRVRVATFVLFGGNVHAITWTMRPEVAKALELLGWV